MGRRKPPPREARSAEADPGDVFSADAILANARGRVTQERQASDLAAYVLEVTGEEIPTALPPPPTRRYCWNPAVCGRVAVAVRWVEGAWRPVCEAHAKGAKRAALRPLGHLE